MSAAGRVLAVDPGTKRVGVAVSDETRALARPLAVLPAAGAAEAVARLAAEHAASLVLVGHPRRLDGSPGTLAPEAEALAARLRTAVGCPVELRDERLTTAEAHERLKAAGKGNRRRGHVDAAAAAVLLQDFLDERRAARGPA